MLTLRRAYSGAGLPRFEDAGETGADEERGALARADVGVRVKCMIEEVMRYVKHHNWEIEIANDSTEQDDTDSEEVEEYSGLECVFGPQQYPLVYDMYRDGAENSHQQVLPPWWHRGRVRRVPCRVLS